jgi:hypothetical protein
MIKKSPPYQCLNSWMRSEIVKAFTRSGVKWTLCIMKNLEMAHSTQKLQNDCNLLSSSVNLFPYLFVLQIGFSAMEEYIVFHMQ